MENNTYNLNNTYTLHPDYIGEMHDGRKYIIFKETIGGKQLRVKALDFLTQPDSGLPSTIDVTVENIDSMSGMPLLKVNRDWLINTLYGSENLPKKYSFTIISKMNKDDYQSLFVKDCYGVTHYFPIKEDDSLDNYSEGERIPLLATEIKTNARGNLYLYLSKPSATDPISQYILAFSTRDNAKNKLTDSQTANFGDESDTVEFKQSLVYSPETNSVDVDAQVFNIMRSIAGFMNNIGGTLYIGVKDDGKTINGIENDLPELNGGTNGYNNYTPNWDGWNRKLIDSIRRYLGVFAASLVIVDKLVEGKLTYAKITIQKSPKPIYVNNKILFLRQCNTTSQLTGDELTWFILERMRGEALEQFIEQKYGYETEVVEDTGNVETEEVPSDNTTLNITSGAIEDERNHNKWLYLRFFKDGHYIGTARDVKVESYEDAELLCDYQLEQYHKNEDQVLLMIYNDSGKVNKIDFEKGANDWYGKERKGQVKGTSAIAPWITEQLVVKCVDRNDMLVAFYKEDDVEYCYVRDIERLTPSQTNRDRALFTGGHKMLTSKGELMGQIMHIPGSYRNWIAPIVNKRVELKDSKKKGTIRRLIEILEEISPEENK